MRRVWTNSMAVVAVLFIAGCEEDGFRIVIRAHASDPQALVAGSYVSASLIDRQSRGDGMFTSLRLPADLGTEDPAVLEIELNGGGEYDAHVMVVSDAGRWYATRCYQVGGVETSDVLLVGPLDEATDDDGDGWPVVDDCTDPGGGPCADPCPAIRANDCNDIAPDLHPGAVDVCQDQIDQDCSGTDALCNEDEAGP